MRSEQLGSKEPPASSGDRGLVFNEREVVEVSAEIGEAETVIAEDALRDRTGPTQSSGALVMRRSRADTCVVLQPPNHHGFTDWLLHRHEDLVWPPALSSRLVLAWALHLAVALVACVVLIVFITVTAPKEMRVRGQTTDEYVGVLIVAYSRSIAQTMLLQEPLKVLIITAVSPQMMPSVHVSARDLLKQTPIREAVRLCTRSLFGAVYVTFVLM
jgi:hypothetical protein